MVVELGKVQDTQRNRVRLSSSSIITLALSPASSKLSFSDFLEFEKRNQLVKTLRGALKSSSCVVAACPSSSEGVCVRYKKVTWLILPVVICLSQRLSHACLSINFFIQWNCVQLIISVIIYLMVTYYMDNRSNSRANTCVKSRLSRGGMYLLVKKPMPVLQGFVVNHSNCSNRTASRWR